MPTLEKVKAVRSAHVLLNAPMAFLRFLPVLLTVVPLLCGGRPARAQSLSDTPREETWVTNGPVNAIAATTDTIYIGGVFSGAGSPTGHGVPTDATTGQIAAIFPKVNGNVNACVADGSGGWYIGGDFTRVGNLARNRLAHILADGSVDPEWHPDTSGSVKALAVSGTRVYAGGTFTAIDGKTRNRIAALNTATGAVRNWNPNANSDVLALAVSGTTVYAGGEFTNIGGQARNRIAAIDAATGAATTWNPSADYGVYALALRGTEVWAGGPFTNIGGRSCFGLATLDPASGAATWAGGPNSDGGAIFAISVLGTAVYVGGTYYSVDYVPPHGYPIYNTFHYFAAFGGGACPAVAGGGVRALATSGTTVYIAGGFDAVGGQTRNGLAAFDAATGAVTAWTGGCGNGGVKTMAASGGAVYVGGEFATISTNTRVGAAAFDAATGTLTDWNPNADCDPSFPDWLGNGVGALAISGSTVYAGGRFTTIGGQTRNRIAALDAATGVATHWNPNASGAVFALATSGSKVYAGGEFTSIGGQTRNCIAALDTTTGVATDWNSYAAHGAVDDLALAGPTLYVGGDAYTFLIDGQCVSNIFALDVETGLARDWNPDVHGYRVYAIAISGTTVYAGGSFTNVGGQTRNYIAALDTATGAATSWNPNANGPVRAVAVSGATVYVGGSFTSIGGQTRNHLAALDATTGLATAWNPNVNGTVGAIGVSGTTLYVGGNFTTVGGQTRPYFAQFDPLPPAATRDWTLYE